MKKIIILSSLLLSFITVWAQPEEIDLRIDSLDWELVSFPEVAKGAHIFVEHEGRLWLSDGALYFSDDEGVTWQRKAGYGSVTNIFSGDFGLVIVSTTTEVGTLYTSRYLNFSISQDNGENFTAGQQLVASSSGMHGGQSLRGVYQVSDSLLIYHSLVSGNFGTFYDIRTSSDGGANWLIKPVMFNPSHTEYHPFHAHQNKLQSLKLLQNSQFWELTTAEFLADTVSTKVEYFQLPSGYAFEPSNYRYFIRDDKIFILFSDGRMISGFYPENDWTELAYPFSDLNITGIRAFEDAFQVSTPGQLWEVQFNNLSQAELVFETQEATTIIAKKTAHFDFASDRHGIYLKNETASDYVFRGVGINYKVSDIKGAGDVIWAKLGDWFRSGDFSESWSRVSDTPLSNGEVLSNFNNIFHVEKDNELFRSVDNGISWDTVTNLSDARKFLDTENEVYVYNRTRLFSSTDGISFTEKIHPRTGRGELVFHNNKLIYFTSSGRFISSDNGNTWVASEVLENNPPGQYFSMGSMLVNVGANGTVMGVHTSSDEGFSWQNQNYLYPIFTSYADLTPVLVSRIDSILFINGRNFTATQDFGQKLVALNAPFYQIATRFGETRRGPSHLFRAGAHLYGFSEKTNFYRTSLDTLKKQLPDVFNPVDPNISGMLYKDINHSCTFDSTDIPLVNKVIRFSNDYVLTDENGHYTYYKRLDNSYNYFTDTIRHTEILCGNTHQGFINGLNRYDTLDIAFQPVPNILDGGLSMYSSDIFQAGQAATIKLKVRNVASLPIQNQIVHFNFDNSFQTISAASDGSLLNDSTWQFTLSLEPNKEIVFSIELLLDNSLSPDSVVKYEARMPISDDVYPDDNVVDFSPDVVIDESLNDKMVHPDTIPTTDHNVDLIYRIRFQNIGTDTAFKVTVIDSLPDDLSIFSLQMLESSHPYTLSLEERNIVRWTFDHINLPGDEINETASSGYLIFKIKTDGTLIANQEIINDAAIYFDTNTPVITNEVVTIVKKRTIIQQDSVTLCEGDPFNGQSITESGWIYETISTPDNDTLFETYITLFPAYRLDTLIFAVPGDTIGGVIVFADTIINQELLTIHNCDSIANYFVKITTTGVGPSSYSDFTASVHPNPSNGTAQLTFNLNNPTMVSATWFTATGQQLRTALHYQPMTDGRHEVPLRFTDLPVGIHFLRIETPTVTKWLKLVKK